MLLVYLHCNCTKIEQVTIKTSNLQLNFAYNLGGVQAYHFGKKYFELGVGGEGQDTSRNFEGSFGFIRGIRPMRGLGAKLGQKPKMELKKV